MSASWVNSGKEISRIPPPYKSSPNETETIHLYNIIFTIHCHSPACDPIEWQTWAKDISLPQNLFSHILDHFLQGILLKTWPRSLLSFSVCDCNSIYIKKTVGSKKWIRSNSFIPIVTLCLDKPQGTILYWIFSPSGHVILDIRGVTDMKKKWSSISSQELTICCKQTLFTHTGNTTCKK